MMATCAWEILMSLTTVTQRKVITVLPWLLSRRQRWTGPATVSRLSLENTSC
jgi:hypothetical protein